MNQRRKEAVREVLDELTRQQEECRQYCSSHEGYAKILEELDELWDEVKKRPGQRIIKNMRREACQVAVRAIRFMMEVA